MDMSLHELQASVHNYIALNDTLRRLFCGAISGICAKTAIAPAERVKMSFQLSNEKFTLTNCYSKFTGMVRNEGVWNLWKGHSANIARVAPYAGLHYAIHDYMEVLLKHSHVTNDDMIIQLISGSLAGAGATAITYPLDVLRVRIAFAPTKTNIITAWKHAIRYGGLYQGFAPTMFGIIPYSGTAWCVKGLLQTHYPKWTNRPLNTSERLGINAIAGLLGQFITYPLDIVRRRMQMLRNDKSIFPSSSNNNTVAILKHLFQTEGWKGLSKGYSLNIIKGPVTLSISLTVYDLLQNYYKILL